MWPTSACRTASPSTSSTSSTPATSWRRRRGTSTRSSATLAMPSGPMAEIPVELVRRTFETNVFSNLELTQHVVRKFVDEQIAGRIIFVSSMGGMLTAYGLGAYCASKHALEGIAASLRDELAPTGSPVQAI